MEHWEKTASKQQTIPKTLSWSPCVSWQIQKTGMEQKLGINSKRETKT